MNDEEKGLILRKIQEDLFKLQKEEMGRKSMAYRGVSYGLKPNLALLMSTTEMLSKVEVIVNKHLGVDKK